MLIDDLIGCGALRFGDFTLTSGAKSRYYVDIKRASSIPAILKRITEGFTDLGVEADKVAGVELGAVPLIVAYSLHKGIPFIIIRKGEREHGTKKRIEGEILPGERVLLLEDVVTSGGSVIKAVDELESAGAKVVRIASVVDREEGGTEKVGAKAQFTALVRAKDLLEEAGRRGY
ncbi:MAG: orotate phosphoribosyltransferase [Candidatus Thermoplasmatota archaeon]|jgi:orotate phosphoribosyltransferase|nr:orotate phosphoribosyltransferase [Candidatus Thermoplasmatota archaeon]